VDWSESLSGSFHHYKTLWSSSETFSGASLVSGSYSTYETKTSGADINATGTRWYRTYAYDSANHVIGKSGTRSATGLGAADAMGNLADPTPDGGMTHFSWPAFSGSEGCFTYYKLVYSSDPDPSYGKAGTIAPWYTTDSSLTAVSVSVPSGTYWFRLQVLRETDLGKFVAAETDSTQYVVP